MSSSLGRCLDLRSHYSLNRCSRNLGWEGEILYVFFKNNLLNVFQLNHFFYTRQLLAGLAIVLGIPFPIWIYYKGEEMRARNPMTRAPTISKKKNSSKDTELGT